MNPFYPKMILFLALQPLFAYINGETIFSAKSGIKAWVDVNTPEEAYTKKSSRGDTWDLVMSDEFNVVGRDFSAGKDYMWTALDLPDGVNAALEYYSPNMTTTTKDGDRGVFQIEVRNDENITFKVYNAYTRPPSFQTISMVSNQCPSVYFTLRLIKSNMIVLSRWNGSIME
jgi:hypothetical protein